MGEWTTVKPKFDTEIESECILLAASSFVDDWWYSSFLIKKLTHDDGWYWGVCNIDGDEWGDPEDLQAELYCIVPMPPLKWSYANK